MTDSEIAALLERPDVDRLPGRGGWLDKMHAALEEAQALADEKTIGYQKWLALRSWTCAQCDEAEPACVDCAEGDEHVR